MDRLHPMISCWMLFVALIPGFAHARPDEGESKTKRDDALRMELLRMVKEDQDARAEVIKMPSGDSPAARKMADIDRKNTARMKEVIDKHGWPGKSLVGDDGAHAAWLLVQHADKDREFQKRCLKLLEKAVKAGEATGMDLAYLTDRVLVAEGKKQVYGTQFVLMDGKLAPSPIEDETNVDRRRKDVGLPTMEEYRKTLEEVYKPRREEKK
jgi:hypothetical protein